MTVYAVIDTNVLISSLLTPSLDSPTIGIIKAIRNQVIIPLYSHYLLSEYSEVLSRSKFKIPTELCEGILSLFTTYGIQFEPAQDIIELPDPDDIPIFLIAMQTRNLDTYLVTGNVKHYPRLNYVVIPKKMMDIIEE